MKNKGLTETSAGVNIDFELKRIANVITKAKGQDHLDPFRIKSPLLQMNLYAEHLANVVYQNEVLGLLAEVEKVLPGHLKTKGYIGEGGTSNIGLIEDIFFPTNRSVTLHDLKVNRQIYGKELP